MDAFDADVLIYAAVPGHPLGRRVRALFIVDAADTIEANEDDGDQSVHIAGVGSVLLLPELLTKPMREHASEEIDELASLLARLDLRPTDQATAALATALGAKYGLRAADAIHLATAVGVGADRFITNNRSDFPTTIAEIDVTYPDTLPDHAPES